MRGGGGMRVSTWTMELYLDDSNSGLAGTRVPFLNTDIQLRDPDDAPSNARVTVPNDPDLPGSFTWMAVYGVRTYPDGTQVRKRLFQGEITGGKRERGFSGSTPIDRLTLLSEGQSQTRWTLQDNFLPPPNQMDSTTSHERMHADPPPGRSSRPPPAGPGLTTNGGGGDDATNDARPGEDAVTDEGPAGENERQRRRSRIKEMEFTKDGAQRVSLGEPSEALTEKVC